MVVRSGICLGLAACSSKDSVLSNARYLTVEDFNGSSVVNVYYKEEKNAGTVKLFLDMLKESKDILN